MDVARAATVAHYLALWGNEPVIRAAHEVFYTEALLEGKWAVMLTCQMRLRSLPGK